MSEIQGSYSHVNYLIRPSKQVERKIIIEALQKLLPLGYDIPAYRYVGMGSIYYVDFLLFHKYLHITDMLCVEARPIERRMLFNKPYEFVDLFMGKVGEVLPRLDRERAHLLWLDYDYPLNDQILGDLSNAVKVAAPGSVVIATVTAQLMELERASNLEEMKERNRKWASQYSEWFGSYIEPVTPPMLSRKNIATLFSTVLRNMFVERVSERREPQLEFLPIFNYRYADGQSMLTFGGLIDTTERIGAIRASRYLEESFVVSTVEPTGISVPQLTVREKHWLDQHLRGLAEADVGGIAFELDPSEIKGYAQYAKYYPIYYETLV
jgi:hypothetical protein